jgi:hypothetical protein
LSHPKELAAFPQVHAAGQRRGNLKLDAARVGRGKPIGKLMADRCLLAVHDHIEDAGSMRFAPNRLE